jgi:elongation factor G
VIANQATPVFCAKQLEEQRRAISLGCSDRLLAISTGYPPVTATLVRDGSEVLRHSVDSEPMSALVFKIVSDPYMGRLAYLRVYSGTVKQNSTVQNSSKDKKETHRQVATDVC